MEVMQGEFLQELLAVMGKFDQHLASIVGGPQAEQKSPFNKPVNQAHGTVRLKLQSLC